MTDELNLKNMVKLREFLGLDHRAMGRAIGGDGPDATPGLHILSWYGVEKRNGQITPELLRAALRALCAKLEVVAPEDEAEKLLAFLHGGKLHWKTAPAWREGQSPIRRAGRPAGSRNKATVELEALKAATAQQPAVPTNEAATLAKVAGEVAFEVATGKIPALTPGLKSLLSLILEGANKKTVSLVLSLALATMTCGNAFAGNGRVVKSADTGDLKSRRRRRKSHGVLRLVAS